MKTFTSKIKSNGSSRTNIIEGVTERLKAFKEGAEHVLVDNNKMYHNIGYIARSAMDSTLSILESQIKNPSFRSKINSVKDKVQASSAKHFTSGIDELLRDGALELKQIKLLNKEQSGEEKEKANNKLKHKYKEMMATRLSLYLKSIGMDVDVKLDDDGNPHVTTHSLKHKPKKDTSDFLKDDQQNITDNIKQVFETFDTSLDELSESVDDKDIEAQKRRQTIEKISGYVMTALMLTSLICSVLCLLCMCGVIPSVAGPGLLIASFGSFVLCGLVHEVFDKVAQSQLKDVSPEFVQAKEQALDKAIIPVIDFIDNMGKKLDELKNEAKLDVKKDQERYAK